MCVYERERERGREREREREREKEREIDKKPIDSFRFMTLFIKETFQSDFPFFSLMPSNYIRKFLPQDNSQDNYHSLSSRYYSI